MTSATGDHTGQGATDPAGAPPDHAAWRTAAALGILGTLAVILPAFLTGAMAVQIIDDLGLRGLTGDEPDGRLIKLMAQHPTLLQRPIGVRGRKAVVGRPPEKLLEL